MTQTKASSTGASGESWAEPKPTALLVLADGTVLEGFGLGATGTAVGEVCFNTAMTGYEEILTDPSYAGQIITFTFPHIGNVGCNDEDSESKDLGFGIQDSGSNFSSLNPESRIPTPRLGACGLVVRELPTQPSSFRSKISLDAWLKNNNIAGISGVDTRALTRHIRKNGAQNACIFRIQDSGFREIPRRHHVISNHLAFLFYPESGMPNPES